MHLLSMKGGSSFYPNASWVDNPKAPSMIYTVKIQTKEMCPSSESKKYGLQAPIQMCTHDSTAISTYLLLTSLFCRGGGSLPNDQLNLESASLLWMVNEAAIAGILLKQSTVEWKIRDLEKRQPQKSLHSLWWLLEYFPVHRQSRSNPDKTSQ